MRFGGEAFGKRTKVALTAPYRRFGAKAHLAYVQYADVHFRRKPSDKLSVRVQCSFYERNGTQDKAKSRKRTGTYDKRLQRGIAVHSAAKTYMGSFPERLPFPKSLKRNSCNSSSYGTFVRPLLF